MRWLVVPALVVSCGLGLADELPEDTNEIKTLTVEQAEALVNQRGLVLSLDGLTTITPEVLAANVRHHMGLPEGSRTPSTPDIVSQAVRIRAVSEELTPQGTVSRLLPVEG